MINLNKEVRYGTQLHHNIMEACKVRRDLSVKVMRKKYPDWKRAEEMHSGYITETEAARLKKEGRTKGIHDFTDINVSMSFATTMSMHTYWTSVFLARTPVLQFTARHGEPEMAIQAVEAIHDYQTNVGRHLMPYYVWLLDVAKFGVGFMCAHWDTEYTISSHFEDIPVTYLGIPIPGKTRRARITDKLTHYEGNKLFNVRPYDMRIDPRVDLQKYQKGEFMGRKIHLTWTDLVQGQEDGKYFNIDQVEKNRLRKWETDRQKAGNLQYPENDGAGSLQDQKMTNVGMLEGEELVVMIQPSEWGLGKTSYPEKWVFTWVEDEVLIGCRPLGAHHGQFPFSVLEYEMDGGLLLKRGVHEILEPMNDTLNWLINTHFFNIRRVLNDNIIVDPGRVVMKDLQNNKPGKIIRLKEAAYGTDVRSIIHQLEVKDVTNQHLADTEIIESLAQKMVGVNDNIMGMVNSGGRKTATEIRTSSTFGINRLKTNSEWFSSGGWYDNVSQMIANTQQYYDKEQVFKLSGDLSGEYLKMTITPESIAGQFDFVPVDGTLPVDRFAQANLWKELFSMMAQIEGIGNQFDMSKIFAYTAQLAGAKNINQFKVKVRPDEEIGREHERGNIRRLGEGDSGRSGGPSGGLESLIGTPEG